MVREAAGRVGRPVAIMQDLPGPKIRIGPVKDDKVFLRGGDPVTFVSGRDDGTIGDESRLTVSWPGLADAVETAESVSLADGAVRRRVIATRPESGEFDCLVLVQLDAGAARDAVMRRHFELDVRALRPVAAIFNVMREALLPGVEIDSGDSLTALYQRDSKMQGSR